MPTPIRCDPTLFKKDLTDQIIIVTGANSGVGFETAKQLGNQGAKVILACRSATKGKEAASQVKGGVFLAPMDLSSLQSIRDFAHKFLQTYQRLDVLINNAGIMRCPYGVTKDGFELQMGCNHLGHFLLFQLLVPTLLKTAEQTGRPSRFVALSSVAAAETIMKDTDGPPDIDLSDLNWKTRPYHEGSAYGASKLANYLHAYEAAQRYPSDKLIAASVHPGWVQSNLDVHAFAKIFGTSWFGRFLANVVRKISLWRGDMITPVDGAQTSLHCVLADDIISGNFYSQFGIYKHPDDKAGGWPMKLRNPNATPEKARKLWELSDQLVNNNNNNNNNTNN